MALLPLLDHVQLSQRLMMMVMMVIRHHGLVMVKIRVHWLAYQPSMPQRVDADAHCGCVLMTGGCVGLVD